MSSDLVWAIVRKHNAFLVKRNGVEFTSEPNNLMNTNSFKNSGLANEKAVGITLPKGKAATMTMRTKSARVPKKFSREVSLNTTRGIEKINSVIESQVDKTYYRRDLKRAALARYTRISQVVAAQQKGVSFKPKTGRSNK